MDNDAIVTKALENHSENMKKIGEFAKQRSAFPALLKIIKEREYCLGITGLRGIGKTILLLQLAKASNGTYFSADDRSLRGTDLYDIVRALAEAGHSSIFIDEIHTKPNWDSDLKSIYDEGLAHVAFSGSSSIKLKALKSDLSRRVVIEHLKPASFREWLHIKKNTELPAISMDKAIREKASLAREFGFAHRHLAEYYRHGGVLYGAKTYFHKTIISTIETIAAKDLSAIREVDADIEEGFFKLLYLIAASRPLELSYSKIGETLGKNKVWVMRFLSEVEKSEAIKRVFPCGEGVKFRKEAKYYLPFPYRSSLCAASGSTPDIGSLREEFFANHVDCCFIRTSSAATADFKCAGKVFEIGGGSKQNRQNADFLVVDGLDTSKNKVPLFLFGMLQ
ncbi:MAG: AAA family ATPase [Candidatus Diapherotrites archaeon]